VKKEVIKLYKQTIHISPKSTHESWRITALEPPWGSFTNKKHKSYEIVTTVTPLPTPTSF